MKTINDKKSKIVVNSMYAGAGVGFLAFLGLGAVPGLLYGGYIGLIMAGAIFGTPVEPTLFSRLMTFGGMGLGALLTMTVFLVAGSCIGTLVGVSISAFQKAAPTSEMLAAETKKNETH